MIPLQIFFLAIIVLELACLAGIFWALRWINRYSLIILGARASMDKLRPVIARQIKLGKITASQLVHWIKGIEQLIPWWGRAILTILRWSVKIKRQTS